MKLLAFEYSNLFSLGKGSISLKSRGLTLVTGFSEDENGANGAGKSSLANKGILFTLFGETAGGLKADSVLNRHGKKSCFGKITFEGLDGVKYRIERKRPAKLSLFKGKNDISAHTAKETQELINSLVGLDYKTFIQTSFFGQGRYAHYPSLTPKEQKAVLEQILPMEEADRWAEYADKQAKSLKPTLDKVTEDMLRASTQATTLKHVAERCQQDGIQFEENRTYRIQLANNKLDDVKAKFKDERDELEALESSLGDPITINSKIDTEIIQAALWIPLRDEAQEQSVKGKNSADLWEAKQARLGSERYAMDTSENCPTCLRDYDESTVKTVQAKATKLEEELDKIKLILPKCYAAIGYYNQRYWHHVDLITKSEQRTSKYQADLLKIDTFSARKALFAAQVSAEEAGARAALEQAEKEENPHAPLFERNKQEAKEAEAIFSKFTKEQVKIREELEHLKHWKDVYGKELKLKLFEDACPFLDARTQYHLGRLKNPQIHCEFSTIKRLATGVAKEEFDVVVWSETGGRGFDALSGGEQQIVSFAIGLTLADLASRVGDVESSFLVLDEPFTELDDRNGEAVIDYLTAEVENGRDTIMLISNEESLKGLIQNRIHVIKSKGISNVSEE